MSKLRVSQETLSCRGSRTWTQYCPFVWVWQQHPYSCQIIQLSCHTAVLSYSCPVIQLSWHTAVLSYSCPVIQLSWHTAVLSYIQLSDHNKNFSPPCFSSQAEFYSQHLLKWQLESLGWWDFVYSGGGLSYSIWVNTSPILSVWPGGHLRF